MVDHVKSTIIEYLAGRVSADELATRLPDGWELDEDGSPEAGSLTLRALACLAEFQRGDRTADSLWHSLSNLVRKPAPPTTGLRSTLAQTPRAEVMTRRSQGAPKDVGLVACG